MATIAIMSMKARATAYSVAVGPASLLKNLIIHRMNRMSCLPRGNLSCFDQPDKRLHNPARGIRKIIAQVDYRTRLQTYSGEEWSSKSIDPARRLPHARNRMRWSETRRDRPFGVRVHANALRWIVRSDFDGWPNTTNGCDDANPSFRKTRHQFSRGQSEMKSSFVPTPDYIPLGHELMGH